MPFSLAVTYKKKKITNNITILVETLHNYVAAVPEREPPQNNSSLLQRDMQNMQITQPCSAPSSPLASPGALSSTSFCMPANSTSGGGTNGHHHNHSACPIDTGDPNWQATKSTVRERNAAMFNNELIADIKFIVGSDG